MLFTRCPTCATVFRVAPEHLKARQGRVRCGQCAQVFNAIEHLVEGATADLLAAESASWPGGSLPASTPPAVDRIDAAPAALPAESLEQATPDFTRQSQDEAAFWRSLADDEPAIQEDVENSSVTRGAAAAPEPDDDSAPCSDMLAMEAPAAAGEESQALEVSERLQVSDDFVSLEEFSPLEPEKTLGPDRLAETQAESFDAVILEKLADESRLEPRLIVADDHLPETARLEGGEHALNGEMHGAAQAPAVFAAAVETTEATPDTPGVMPLPEAPKDTPWTAQGFTSQALPPKHRHLWLAAAVILALAAVLQSLFVFRTDLAAQFPDSRPMIQSLCEVLGADLPLPRKTELVGIEVSDLHPDSQGRPLLTLTASLRNRASYTQAFPHLELTLTDAEDKALLRRVLSPRDYLPKLEDEAKGFASNGEMAIQVNFDAGRLAAAGYRLYLFYP